MPRRTFLPLVLPLIFSGGITAENLPPAFELADVHPSAPDSPWAIAAMQDPTLDACHGELRGGRYQIHSATLVDLISTAWKLDPAKLIGGPAWLDTARFDVIAQVPAEASVASIPGMLQTLLADRFHLRVHPETRPFAEFVLTAGSRPLLKSSQGAGDPGCSRTSTPADVSITCRNISMSRFAQTLPQLATDYFGGNPLIDQTRIAGSFDFRLHWTPRQNFVIAGSGGVPLAAAIEKQLSLHLALRDVPELALVVDHADQIPTPNEPEIRQLLPSVPPAFEVATIKPASPQAIPGKVRFEPGGLVDIQGLTLKSLIKFAWGFEDMDAIDNDDLLSGAPKFSQSVRYDVVARAPATGPTDRESLLLMLRALLADRFGLATHIERRPITVLALVAGKPHLQPADSRYRSGCRNIPAQPQSGMFSVPVFSLRCRNMTLAQFVPKLQALAGKYVVHPAIDATGLAEAFDFTLNWSPPHLVDSTMPADPNGSLTLIEAMDKQLGLRLKTVQHDMPVTVIDHLNPNPTPN